MTGQIKNIGNQGGTGAVGGAAQPADPQPVDANQLKVNLGAVRMQIMNTQTALRTAHDDKDPRDQFLKTQTNEGLYQKAMSAFNIALKALNKYLPPPVVEPEAAGIGHIGMLYGVVVFDHLHQVESQVSNEIATLKASLGNLTGADHHAAKTALKELEYAQAELLKMKEAFAPFQGLAPGQVPPPA